MRTAAAGSGPPSAEAATRGKISCKRRFASYFKRNWDLYLMSVPGLLFLIVYKFIPLYGLTLAFKDFSLFAGDGIIDSVVKSPWVGMKHFNKIFQEPVFMQVIGNTLIISLYKLVFLFPVPILLAICLNELRLRWMKRWVQTIVYMPHFLSWVIIFGLFYSLFGSYGMVNQALGFFGIGGISFFSDAGWFRSLLVFTEGWKESGWNTILFLAAMTAIDPQLYEASVVDGAGRMKRIWHITIPGIVPVIMLVFVLRLGQVLNAGFEQVLVMYNPAVYNVADIIQTYVYRIGLGRLDFSLSTALGLFESVVAMALIFTSNQVTRRYLGKSLW
ncbi:putative aldouronate transport system permease protein [Paenibacillus sp. UNCCL117]|uniref:ABC transporter permease n=1 Tax=unclassified Paenibacillus TaxID=185978 RepID=UPI000886A461|nr:MULTISPECIES: ABC transporter permease subunit [unclassified Paenibacillus]SDD69228.1 putative aldouronate transport system permease protein [Paenibacillus sp. cl123]SFW45099.1 putative aldouronate transport system permease protein [Paenibacillus sp. UNCCL117]